ncbi:thiopurine S-methyltransferase [Aureococcus anophagefferens]|nr:thiopurine S-methyltransferase [Aureococcus anophagefferens]
MASLAAAQDSSDSDDEAHFWPFAEAFEDDTQTYPYGTLSAVASHVTTPRETALAAARRRGATTSSWTWAAASAR